jgi:prepilin-type N-terminal cleavage/methylation domain-containing protein
MKGFTLLELIITLLIIIIAATIVTASLGAATANLKPDQLLVDIAASLLEAKREAQRGVIDQNKRTFNLKESLKLINQGSIIITTEPLTSTSVNQCNNGCSTQQAVMCISGQPFCFTPSSIFTFERFSGKLQDSHVIYILSTKRKLALLINKTGGYSIAEFLNGEWKARAELQKSFSNPTKDDEITPK